MRFESYQKATHVRALRERRPVVGALACPVLAEAVLARFKRDRSADPTGTFYGTGALGKVTIGSSR